VEAFDRTPKDASPVRARNSFQWITEVGFGNFGASTMSKHLSIQRVSTGGTLLGHWMNCLGSALGVYLRLLPLFSHAFS